MKRDRRGWVVVVVVLLVLMAYGLAGPGEADHVSLTADVDRAEVVSWLLSER